MSHALFHTHPCKVLLPDPQNREHIGMKIGTNAVLLQLKRIYQLLCMQDKIKILTIMGARPQIIKAAALSRAIRGGFADRVEEKILHTGQHYDANMSAVFFQELGIPAPHYNLHIGSGRHGAQTAGMMAGIEDVLVNEPFDAVVLFGDTNSTLAGALAAAKLHVPIVHIEAGLRSFNMAMPEEVNRIVCDQVSTLLFAPTHTAMDNLRHEGFFTSPATFAGGRKRHIWHSGDIMYDNSLFFADLANNRTDIIRRLGLEGKPFILTTIHRDHNTDNPERLSSILKALAELACTEGLKVVLPLHPRTRKTLQTPEAAPLRTLLQDTGILLLPPASFFEMIELERHARIIMTDSGGVQKEAYFFQKPCVILRPETEWTEIVQQHTGILADANTERIIAAFHTLTADTHAFPPIFGDGHAAEFILEKIVDCLQKE